MNDATPIAHWRPLALAAVTLTVAFLSCSIIWLNPGRASAAGNGRWSIFPTSTPGQLHARPYFEPLLSPGVPVQDSVTITNETSAPLNFNVYASDAFNTKDGAFSLHLRADPKRDIGAWIQLPVDNITVPADTAANIPFVILPPVDATPGDHVGGIIAESTAPNIANNGNVQINQVEAVGARMYARVRGPLHPALQVTGLVITTRSGLGGLLGGRVSARVRYTVVNTGNVRLDPSSLLRLSPLFGSAAHKSRHLPELLPRGSATVQEQFSGIEPDLILQAHVSITSTGAVAAASATAWVVPWLLLAVIVAAAGGAYVWYRRRRRGAPPGKVGPDLRPKPAPREVAQA